MADRVVRRKPPSLTAYRILLAICAGAAVAGALLAVLIPAHSATASAEAA